MKKLLVVMVLFLGLCVGATWAQQTPFAGGPRKLPGRILWEHYDEGGEGIAYHEVDTTRNPANATWRPTSGVDGDEPNIGWVADGEWVEFTVDVTPGTYDLTIATCMPFGNTGRSVVFTWEGAADPNFAIIACPETGGWAQSNIVLTTVQDVTVTVSGPQTLRTTFLGGSCNYWWFQLSPKSLPTNPAPADGQTGLPVGANTLSWIAADPLPADFVGHKVYFSTVLLDVLKQSEAALFGPGTGTSVNVSLVPGARYYWSVDSEIADANDIFGNVWYFDSYTDMPVFTTQPQSELLWEDCSAAFTVETVSENLLTYQWYDAAGALAGQTGATLITGVPGSYYCIATNTVTSQTAQSATATLTRYPVDLMANLGHYNLGNPADAENGWGLQSSSVSGDTITMTAAGADLWGGEDEGRLVAVPVIGDNIEVIAKVVLTGQGTSGWGGPSSPGTGQQWIKAGVTIRDTLAHNSQHLSMYVTSGNGRCFQGRRTTGGSQGIGTAGQGSVDYTEPVWVRLVREGNSVTAYYGSDGVNWTLAAADLAGGDPIYNPMTLPIAYGEPVYVGVAGTSHDRALTTVIRFEDVQIRAYRAANPSPADGATGVDYTAPITLSWDPDRKSPCPAEYDVRVSTDPNIMGAAPVRVSSPMHTITAGHGQKIYWMVETVGGSGQGPVWTFDTATPIAGPLDVSVLAGSNAHMSVEIAEYNSLQWYGPAGPIPGVTGKTLSLSNVGPSDEGEYYCIASTASGDVQSRKATLDVILLIAHYKFEGDVLDSSGYDHHGTMMKLLPTDPNAGFGPGIVGNTAIGVNIDAEYGQHVVFGSVGISGTMPRTISCWAKAAVDNSLIDTWSNIFGFTSATTGNDKSFDFNRRGNAPNGYCIHVYGWERDLAAVDDQWHLLTASYDGTAISWYHNGSFVGRANRALITEDLLHLGKRAHSEQLWRGWVDDARVYDGALDNEAVATLYLATIADGTPCVGAPAGDLNGDCVVNLEDFAIWALGWGWCDILPQSNCFE